MLRAIKTVLKFAQLVCGRAQASSDYRTWALVHCAGFVPVPYYFLWLWKSCLSLELPEGHDTIACHHYWHQPHLSLMHLLRCESLLVKLQPGFSFLGATIRLSFMKGLKVTPRMNCPFQSFLGLQPAMRTCVRLKPNSGPTFWVTSCKVFISPFRYWEQSYRGRVHRREHGL